MFEVSYPWCQMILNCSTFSSNRKKVLFLAKGPMNFGSASKNFEWCWNHWYARLAFHLAGEFSFVFMYWAILSKDSRQSHVTLLLSVLEDNFFVGVLMLTAFMIALIQVLAGRPYLKSPEVLFNV